MIDELYSVYIEGKGFIATFDLMQSTYTTIESYEKSDYFTSELDALRVAFAFNGIVLKTV